MKRAQRATPIQELQDSINSIFGFRSNRGGRAKPVDTARKAREAAKSLAAQHGIVIEKQESDAFWVTCPKLENDDPLEGNHFCTAWDEVLVAVNCYADFLKQQTP